MSTVQVTEDQTYVFNTADFGTGSWTIVYISSLPTTGTLLLNGVAVAVETADLIGASGRGWDVVLVGDMCYEQPLAERLTAWLRMLAAKGVVVLLGDPGRSYVPTTGLIALARYEVATSRELEDRDSRDGVVWRVEME